MSKFRASKTFVFLVLLSVVLVALNPGASAAQGAPIPIGVAVAQSGGAALFGQEQVIGAQLAEEYINGKGGVNGRPIKLIFEDAASDETGAINAFQTLINRDQVVAIMGPTLSQQAFASNPIANDAGVPIVAPSNTARGIPQIGPFISRVSAPVNFVAPNAVKAATSINPNIKRVVVFFAQDDAFSKSETVVFQETVKALGLELVDPVQTFSVKDTDFTTQITNALAAAPDLIVISGLANDSGNLVKQLRELGYTGLIVGGNGLNSPNMFPVCKAQCDGVIVAQAYSPTFEGEVNKTFRAAYEAKQGKVPGQFSAQAFAGIQVIVEALTRLDSRTKLDTLDIKTLRAELQKEILAGTYETPLGTLSFTQVKKDDGSPAGGEINQKQFYVAQIKMSEDGEKGAFELVSVVNVEESTATPEATPKQ